MQQYKRWYDFDPELQKLINILKDYQEELKSQAEIFLSNVEKVVSKEAIEDFYQKSKQLNGGNRWYDKDPIISRTIELLRIIPKKTQNDAAVAFMNSLRENGINID